jgi:hypothetical protein
MPQQGSVLGQRCEFVYRRLPPALLASAALGVLLGAALWRSRPQEIILFWLGVMLLLSAATAALWWAYRRAAPPAEACAPWVRRLAIAAAGLGAGWGFAAAVFFPGGNGEQVLVAFTVALVASGAVPVFSTLWWVYGVYAAAVLLPFGVVLLAYG